MNTFKITLYAQTPLRILYKELEYDADKFQRELEELLYSDIIGMMIDLITFNNKPKYAYLSTITFSEPLVYYNDIIMSQGNRLEFIKNVNRRKLQFILNRQFTNINFPEDRAIFGTSEWQRYGGS